MHPDLAALVARPIAHRGLHACGGSGPVENSIGAAQAAIAAGYGIECDVLLSRDGEAMIFHDEELLRLTGRSGRLADVSAADLSELPLTGGADRIPTLGQFLNAIDGRSPLVIEVKRTADLRLIERTLELAADYRGIVAIESFDPAVVRHARGRGTTRPLGLVGPVQAGHELEPDVLTACDFLSWSIEDLARVTALYPNVPRTSWTVRSPAQAALAREHAAQIVFEGFRPSTRH